MPFDELETHTRHNQPPTALLSYMRPAGKNGRKVNELPRLTVTIPTVICGTGKAKTHILLLGSGPDKGKLRIKGAGEKKKGAVPPSEFKSHFIWRFGHVPKLGDEAFEKERCPVRKIGDDEFEVDVNDGWFNGG